MLLPRFAPVTIVALLLTLVFIFAFQAQNIMGKTVHVVLIAVPILLQVYVNASLAYGLMHRFRVPHAIAAPGALIGASNFSDWRWRRPLRCSVPNPERRWRPWWGTGGGAGHVVGLWDFQSDQALVHARGGRMKPRVLFLCTGNSARSQMAEGWLRHLAGDRYDVCSAGTQPVGLNPGSVEAMAEVGIDISHHRSKHVAEYATQPIGYVITVCDRAKESCPRWSGDARLIHWSFDDPAAVTESAEQRRQVFRRVRDEIAFSIREFLASVPA